MSRHVRDRLGAGVKRYHVKRTLNEDTIASHSWGVAILCMRLMPNCSADLLKAALTHDLGEYETGDMPANVKWINPQAATELKLVEDRVNEANGYTFEQNLNAVETAAFKFCDMLDLVWFCAIEKRMGNSLVDDVFHRGVTACHGRIRLEFHNNAHSLLQEVQAYANRALNDAVHDTSYKEKP